MNQAEKLCLINIPVAREKILKSIAEYRRMHTLAKLMKEFFDQMNDLYIAGKKLDARLKDKLQTILVTQAPELKVYSVRYEKTIQLTSSLPEFQFKVLMYDMENGERSWTLRAMNGAGLNIADAMVADMRWAMHADFLESKLDKFAYNAGKFNDMVKALAGMSLYSLPEGEHFPVYPLSDFFHFYQLHDADVRRGF